MRLDGRLDHLEGGLAPLCLLSQVLERRDVEPQCREIEPFGFELVRELEQVEPELLEVRVVELDPRLRDVALLDHPPQRDVRQAVPDVVVDFYLDDKYTEQREDIIRLSTLSPVEARKQDANGQIMGYIREAQSKQDISSTLSKHSLKSTRTWSTTRIVAQSSRG